jgi:hypothetical protein
VAYKTLNRLRKALPRHYTTLPVVDRTGRLGVLRAADNIDLRDDAFSRHWLQACLREEPTKQRMHRMITMVLIQINRSYQSDER